MQKELYSISILHTMDEFSPIEISTKKSIRDIYVKLHQFWEDIKKFLSSCTMLIVKRKFTWKCRCETHTPRFRHKLDYEFRVRVSGTPRVVFRSDC